MEHLSHTTDDTVGGAEEEILTHTVSDEVLEAAAGTEGGRYPTQGIWWPPTHKTFPCC